MTPAGERRRSSLPLPRLLVLTDRTLAARTGRALPDLVAAVTSVAGVGVVYREKDLEPGERARLGCDVAAAAGAAPLVVADDPDLARLLRAEGIHLAADAPRPREVTGLVVGRSCHDTVEVTRADRDHDYVTLSPVAASVSKPGHGPAVDAATFAEAVAVGPPVWALGGIVPGGAAPWRARGAAGVAVCGAVMGADDPAAVTAALVAEVAT